MSSSQSCELLFYPNEGMSHWSWFAHLHVDSPKPWMRYVTKRLEQIIKSKTVGEALEKTSSFLKFTFHLKIQYKIQFSLKNHIMEGGPLSYDFDNRIHVKHSTLTRETIITRPLGHIALDATNISTLKQGLLSCGEKKCTPSTLPWYRNGHTAFEWHFDMVTGLRLRSVFYDTSIQRVYQSCLRGNVSHISKNPASYSHYSQFSFCGIHSPTVIYSSSRSPEVHLKCFNDIKCMFGWLYFVMGRDIIVTKRLSSNFPLSSLLHLSKLNKFLFILHIQVPNFERLCIFTNLSHESVLFDGPSVKSKLFVTENLSRTFCVSSFQALIQITQSGEQQASQFKFTSISTTRKKMFPQDNQSVVMSIPQTWCETPQCLWCIFELSTNQTLNITIKSVSFGGQVTSSCIYFGMAFYEKRTNDEQSQTALVCDTEIGSPRWRSQYFNQGSVLLVVYSYAQYGNVSATVTVKTTVCKAAKLDICAFSHCHCQQTTPKCSHILEWFVNQTDLKFQIRHQEITFDGHPDSCGVLQIGSDLIPCTDRSWLYESADRCHGMSEYLHYACLLWSPSIVLYNTYDSHKMLTLNIVGQMMNYSPGYNSHKFFDIHVSTGFSFKQFYGDSYFWYTMSASLPFRGPPPKLSFLKRHLVKSSRNWLDLLIFYTKISAPSSKNTVSLNSSIGKLYLAVSFLSNFVLLIKLSERDIVECSTYPLQKFFLLKQNKMNLVWQSGFTYLDTFAGFIRSYRIQYPTEYLYASRFETTFSLSCGQESFHAALAGKAENVTVKFLTSWAGNRSSDVIYTWLDGHSLPARIDIFSKRKDLSLWTTEDQAKLSKILYPGMGRSLHVPGIDVILQTDNKQKYHILQSWLGAVDRSNHHYFVSTVFNLNTDNHFTWEAASFTCKSVGGHLPVFQDQYSAEELMTLLKVTEGLAWIRALFVGLKVHM